MFRSLVILLLLVVCVPIVRAQQPASDTSHEVISNVTSTSANTPEARHPLFSTIIYTDLFTNIFQGNIAYLRKIGDHFGVGGGIHVPTLADEKGVGITGELRVYPGKRALSGFYLAPNASANLYSIRVDGVSSSAAAISAGLMIAYDWIFQGGFVAGIGIGADYFTFKRKASYTLRDRDGVNPAFRFDLGWAW